MANPHKDLAALKKKAAALRDALVAAEKGKKADKLRAEFAAMKEDIAKLQASAVKIDRMMSDSLRDSPGNFRMKAESGRIGGG